MKLKLVIAALIIAGASACTQKTCPTYAKDDSDKSEIVEKHKV